MINTNESYRVAGGSIIVSRSFRGGSTVEESVLRTMIDSLRYPNNLTDRPKSAIIKGQSVCSRNTKTWEENAQ